MAKGFLSELFGGFAKADAAETTVAAKTETGATTIAETKTGAVATEEGSTTEAEATETTAQASVGMVTLSVAEYDTMKVNAGLVNSLTAKASAFESKAAKWDAHETALGNAGVGGDATNTDNGAAQAGEDAAKIRRYFNL
jgi:hypothetical protein